MHHVIPLGIDCTVSESTDKIRSNKKHLLNSPLNMLYISDFSNNKINNASLDSYALMIPKGAGLTNVGFTSTDIRIDSSDDERKKVLEQRYNSLLHTVQQEMNTLLDFNRI